MSCLKLYYLTYLFRHLIYGTSTLVGLGILIKRLCEMLRRGLHRATLNASHQRVHSFTLARN